MYCYLFVWLHVQLCQWDASCFAVVQGSCSRASRQFKHRHYTGLFNKKEDDKKYHKMTVKESKDGENVLPHNYKHPVFSPSFQAYVSSATQSREFHTELEEGVRCTGEPSTDPSRDLQNIGGLDSDWLEDVVYGTEFIHGDDSNP